MRPLAYPVPRMVGLHVVARTNALAVPSLGEKPLTELLKRLIGTCELPGDFAADSPLDLVVDLAYGLVRLVGGAHCRHTLAVQSEGACWEIGLETDGVRLRTSLYTPASRPQIFAAAHEVDLSDLRQWLNEAFGVLVREASTTAEQLMLQQAQRAVWAIAPEAAVGPVARYVNTSVEQVCGALKVRADLRLRLTEPGSTQSPSIERACLHSLLHRGQWVFECGAQSVALPGSHPFVDAERLLALAEDALVSWRGGRPTFRRTALSAGRVCLRRGPDEAPLELRIGRDAEKHQQAVATELSPQSFVQWIAGFAIRLTERLIAQEPAHALNLRLTEFSRRAQDLLEQVDESLDEGSVPNPAPESYRRYAQRGKRLPGKWDRAAKMRFAQNWVATVPGIDLRASFLCGDRFIVSTHQETACLDRRSGQVLWKTPSVSGACVVTPLGLIRIERDGRLSCQRLESGETRFQLHTTPRGAGGVAGSVLYGLGLPKLLALCEGQRQVRGIDLISGTTRWRFSARRPGMYRVRKAGRLLIVSGGDRLMIALDGMTGEVVWSLRSRFPFTGDVVISGDAAYTLSGAPGGTFHLHRFDPWSGGEVWKAELGERPLPGRAPIIAGPAVVLPFADPTGQGAVAFDAITGERLWYKPTSLSSGGVAWTSVDGLVLANCATGVLMGFEAATGAVRYNHVFSESCDADTPRHLEPVLRSGALFVPQQDVHVIRPRDGELLGAVPSDLIPDLVRVDERCNVYVAEESGHLAAFGVAPQLDLVR